MLRYPLHFIYFVVIDLPFYLPHLLHLRGLPSTHETKPLLIPPPLLHPLSRPPLCFQSEVYDKPILYVLCHRVLPFENLDFQFLQDRLQNRPI